MDFDEFKKATIQENQSCLGMNPAPQPPKPLFLRLSEVENQMETGNKALQELFNRLQWIEQALGI